MPRHANPLLADLIHAVDAVRIPRAGEEVVRHAGDERIAADRRAAETKGELAALTLPHAVRVRLAGIHAVARPTAVDFGTAQAGDALAALAAGAIAAVPVLRAGSAAKSPIEATRPRLDALLVHAAGLAVGRPHPADPFPSIAVAAEGAVSVVRTTRERVHATSGEGVAKGLARASRMFRAYADLPARIALEALAAIRAEDAGLPRIPADPGRLLAGAGVAGEEAGRQKPCEAESAGVRGAGAIDAAGFPHTPHCYHSPGPRGAPQRRARLQVDPVRVDFYKRAMQAPRTGAFRRQSTWIYLGLWASIALVLVIFHNVLLPFGGALFVAYVAAPLVDRLAGRRIGKFRVPRGLAIAGLFAALLLIIYGFSLVALPQLYRETVRLSQEVRELAASLTPQRIAELSDAAQRWLVERDIPVLLDSTQSTPPPAVTPAEGMGEGAAGARLVVDLDQALKDAIASGTEWLRSHALELVELSQKLVSRLVGGIFMFFFMLMVAAFLLIDAHQTMAFVRKLAPPSWRPSFAKLLGRIDVKLAGAVRGQIVICLVNGALTLVGLLLFKVKFAFVLATIATVLTFIPIFGTVISTIPIVLVALTQSFSTALAALLWITAIHALEAYLLNPKILGTSAKIHPALIAFSILAGQRTFGFAGALFAVPVASILLATFDHFRRKARIMDGEEVREIEEEAGSPADLVPGS